MSWFLTPYNVSKCHLLNITYIFVESIYYLFSHLLMPIYSPAMPTSSVWFWTAPEPVSRHMEEQGLEFLQFAFRWFNCLLIREVCLTTCITSLCSKSWFPRVFFSLFSPEHGSILRTKGCKLHQQTYLTEIWPWLVLLSFNKKNYWHVYCFVRYLSILLPAFGTHILRREMRCQISLCIYLPVFF